MRLHQQRRETLVQTITYTVSKQFPQVKKIEVSQDKKDTIFEIEITTNRPDWLSHIGVAREIAAVQNTSFKLPSVAVPR